MISYSNYSLSLKLTNFQVSQGKLPVLKLLVDIAEGNLNRVKDTELVTHSLTQIK